MTALIWTAWMWTGLLACTGDDTTPLPTTTGETGLSDSPWSIVADQVPGGVMLAAWTDPGTDEVLIVGGGFSGGPGTLWRYDGTSLCHEEVVADQPLWWIHGRGADDWTAVGAAGTVLRNVGGSRTRDDVPTDATLFGVFDDGGTLWVVGGDVSLSTGEAWRKPDGGDWEQIAAGPGLMFKVWEDWFVGERQAWRWDGTQMVDHFPETGGRFMTVRGDGPDDVWAVGDGQIATEVHHYVDGVWSSPELEPRCAGQGLNGVWTAPGEDVWVAGFFGIMARWDGSAWECPDVPLTAEHFHAAWRWHDETLFLGGNMFDASGHYGTVGRHGGAGEVAVSACP